MTLWRPDEPAKLAFTPRVGRKHRMTAEATRLVISALGGAVGALLLRSIIKLIGASWARWSPLAVHDCTNPSTGPGDIHHGWGHRVDDPNAANKQAWEHTTQQLVPGREHTIYGPYVNDFGRPGFYRVRFRIYGSGFQRTNKAVVMLDVIQSRFGTHRDLQIIGQRTIREKDLAARYQKFDVYCYAPGTSVYEYRCSVVSSAFNSAKHTLRFDTVKVYLHIPLWEVF